MPLIPDSPNTKDVQGPIVSKNLSKMHIHEFRVMLDPNAPDGSKIQLYIKWSEGYEDGGKYYASVWHVDTFQGTDLESALAANTTGGSFYGEIKAKLWTWLQAQGKAPAGTIS
jgi:hypothetical protein